MREVVVLILPPKDVQPGMCLAAPVPHPGAADQDLLNRGFKLTAEVIARLVEVGVETIYIEHDATTDLNRQLAPLLLPARANVAARIAECFAAARTRTRPPGGFNAAYAAGRELIAAVQDQGPVPQFVDRTSRTGGDDAVTHAASVTHLAIATGLQLEYYLIRQRKRLPPDHAREVSNLAVAGMLHDLGKTRLPPSLQAFHGLLPPADPEARVEWELHTRHSYEMIKSGVEASAAVAILHHHQHYDGTGFPVMPRDRTEDRPQTGEEIHVFARILAAADLFDRVAQSRSPGPRLSNLETHHLLRGAYGSRVDPVVLEAMGVVAPPYAPGSLVTLSDDTTAVVVRTNVRDVYCPIVRRIEGDDYKLAAESVDLSEPGAPRVTRAGGRAVAPYLPATTAEPAAPVAPPTAARKSGLTTAA